MALVTLALAAVLAAAPDPLAPYSSPGQLIELADGRTLNIVCMGRGAPTVVLEAGWSSWSLDWAPVQSRLSQSSRVCAYDRAGLGFSSPDPRPKTLATVVADETELLDRAGIAGPLILVGHSKGAVFVRAFAAAHPDRVAGLVLVDPGSPERDEAFDALDADAEARARAEIDAALTRCLERAKEGVFTVEEPQDAFCVDEGEDGWNPLLRAAYLAVQHSVSYAQTRRAEVRIGNALPGSARGAHALGDKPLVVLKAEVGLSQAIPEPRRSEMNRIADAVVIDLAGLSGCGEVRWIADSGHMIAQDQPDAVISAVETVIARARSKAQGLPVRP